MEFKSSLRWDYRQNARNEDLQIAVMKAICGMLNSQGGILLVGVQDDGTVIGIERDLKTLQKQSADGFELLLTDLVKNYLGLEHRNRVHVDFAREGGRQVCVIAIERSPAPVFLHIGGRDEFWVRMGNSTRQLDAKAALHYIQAHWSDAG
ncbi:MAG: ATP-binding protein [Anaerolineae bacterium]|nr:ATP-binding protein [Anaerolineae bacterium]